MKPLVVVIASQLLFTMGDLLARLKMRQLGFGTEAFMSWWFAGYMLIRTAATFGQLWVLAGLVLGQALPMFAASSVVLSMLLSVTVLNEGPTTKTVVGGLLAVAALAALTLGCQAVSPGALLGGVLAEDVDACLDQDVCQGCSANAAQWPRRGPAARAARC